MYMAYDMQLKSSDSVWGRIHELSLSLCSFALVYKSLFMSEVALPVQEWGCSTQSYESSDLRGPVANQQFYVI